MEVETEIRRKGMITFTVTWAGQLVSTLGSGLTTFAVGVWIYEETGSATLFAITLLVWTLPNILFAPLAGVITDRWDRRMVLILSDTGAVISTMIVLFIILNGELQVWHIYLAAFANSSFTVFQWPAFSASTSLLVPKEHLGRAGGMTQIGEAMSGLLTPAVSGALYVNVGLETILLIDIATYLVALGTLLVVRFPQPESSAESQESRGSFLREAFYGWNYIRARPGLLGLLCVFACMNFLMSLTYPLLTPMLLDMVSPAIVGYVNSIAGLGMLTGTLIMSVWGGTKRRIFNIFGAESLVGLFMILLGMRPSIPLISGAGFGIDAALPISGASSQAIWQSKVAQDVQGRVFSIRRMIAFSVIPLAFGLAGLLADRVFEPAMQAGGALAPVFGPLIGVGPGRGIGLMYLLSGVLYLILALVIPIHPRIRQVELELADAV